MEPCCGLAVRRRGYVEGDFMMKHGRKVLLKKKRKKKEVERLLIKKKWSGC
jgi:hypothetical protein